MFYSKNKTQYCLRKHVCGLHCDDGVRLNVMDNIRMQHARISDSTANVTGIVNKNFLYEPTGKVRIMYTPHETGLVQCSYSVSIILHFFVILSLVV